MSLPEPLTSLLARVQSFQVRDQDGDPRFVAAAYAAVYRAADRDQVLAQLAEIAVPVDDETRDRLKRGRAWNVKNFDSLVARLLPEGREEDDGEESWGFPIWDHGLFDQAQTNMTSNAKHLMRFLDDYNEQIVSARRRAADKATLREKPDADAESLRLGRGKLFNDDFPSWRETIRAAVVGASWDEAIQAVRDRTMVTLKGTESFDELLAILELVGQAEIAAEIVARRRTREETLAKAAAVLVYEQFEFLTLTGVRGGESVRQHLPTGLHLIFEQGGHHRTDRTAGLWLDACPPENRCGPYHWLPSVPAAYHDAKKSEYFRLTDDNLVAYVMRNDGS